MSSARRAAAAIAALAAGAALPLCLAPYGIWPLALACPALLAALSLNCSPRAAFLRGWLFGTGMFGTGVSWVYVSIHVYGAAPVPLAAFLTLLFCAGLGLFPALQNWAWARSVRGRSGGLLFGFPALWVISEWSRAWVLTGFPWLYLGYSQLDGPLAGWAPVLGVYGLSLVLAFSAATLVALCLPLLRAATDRGQGPLPPDALPQVPLWERALPAMAPGLALAFSATLWLAAWPLARVEWTAPSGAPLSVALVQGNIPQQLKWDPDHLDNTLAIYDSLSAPLWGTDLVVWPEASVPAYFDLVTGFVGEQAGRAAAAGSTLLLGLPTREPDEARRRGFAVFNSVLAVGADSGIYHKRHLVPFGEYVPMEGWLRGLIAFLDLPMSSFSSGPAVQQPLPAQGLSIAPFVCYEIVYPDLVREAMPGAALLLTVSNDTWFGASIGPLQHLQIAQMRALENGRDLVRGTNNGVSALVDARGRITARGAQFRREVVQGTVQPRSGLTPFARTGSWPVLLLCAALLLGIGAPGRATPRRD